MYRHKPLSLYLQLQLQFIYVSICTCNDFFLQHVIFVVSAFLAFLVPDVPMPVQDEINREKLLAYEALHNKKN